MGISTRFSVLAGFVGLLFSATSIPSFAADAAVAPNRAPDYRVDSGWVLPNLWFAGELGWCNNELSYALPFRVPSPGKTRLVYRLDMRYRYVGEITCNAASPVNVSVTGDSWNAFWIGHDAHSIGGPQWNSAPIPFMYFPFNGVSAGGAGHTVTLCPGETRAVDVTFGYAEAGDGGYWPENALTYQLTGGEFNQFQEVDHVRRGHALHDVWFTPACSPGWTWNWQSAPPAGSWNGTHSPVGYGVQVLERIQIDVWEE